LKYIDEFEVWHLYLKKTLTQGGNIMCHKGSL